MGHLQPLSQLPGQFTVGGDLSVGNLLQQGPHRHAEFRARQVQRRDKMGPPSGKIQVQPAARRRQHRGLLFPGLGQSRGKVLLSREPQTYQARVICRHENLPQGRAISLDIEHGHSPSLCRYSYAQFMVEISACQACCGQRKSHSAAAEWLFAKFGAQ